MPLLQPMSSTGVRAAGCRDGMGVQGQVQGWRRHLEGKADGEGIRKAKPFVSGVCSECLGVPQSGLERGNETETEVWFLVCCR